MLENLEYFAIEGECTGATVYFNGFNQTFGWSSMGYPMYLFFDEYSAKSALERIEPSRKPRIIKVRVSKVE